MPKACRLPASVSLVALATFALASEARGQTAAPAPGALLYLIRGGAADPQVRAPVVLDGASALEAAPGSYGAWQIPAGRHQLVGLLGGQSYVSFDAEAARPIYVCQQIAVGPTGPVATLAVIDEQAIPSCKVVSAAPPAAAPAAPAVVPAGATPALASNPTPAVYATPTTATAPVAAAVGGPPAPPVYGPEATPVASVAAPADERVGGLRFGGFVGGVSVPSVDVTALGVGLTLTVASTSRRSMEPRLSLFYYQSENPDTATTGVIFFGHESFWFGTYGLGFGGGFGYGDFSNKSNGWDDDSMQVIVYGSPVLLRFGRRPTFEVGLQTGINKFFSHDEFLPYALFHFGLSI
jgi:hypothetical protein